MQRNTGTALNFLFATHRN
uniref:Uncharacterized protein n=1 Tax=Anguilla anguilla TaxID=7936 RepID=A0A0E9RVB6_ANGAN